MKELGAVSARYFFNGIGFLGVVILLYKLVAWWTKSSWIPLESSAIIVSSFLTILGTMLTALSAYPRIFRSPVAPSNQEPTPFSKIISAPLVIFVCVVALYLILAGHGISQLVVNGFALLGVAGAFFRLQPRPTLPL
jgi:uncharacterized membrane protein